MNYTLNAVLAGAKEISAERELTKSDGKLIGGHYESQAALDAAIGMLKLLAPDALIATAIFEDGKNVADSVPMCPFVNSDGWSCWMAKGHAGPHKDQKQTREWEQWQAERVTP